MWHDSTLEPLIGRNIVEVRIDEQHLAFKSEDGKWFHYSVYGDCCSQSYFYDFHGVEKLLKNGPIISAREIDLFTEDEEVELAPRYQDYVVVYGYELVTEHPLWGPQTSVFSFRNDSNGYYGGSLEGPTIDDREPADVPIAIDDVIETQPSS